MSVSRFRRSVFAALTAGLLLTVFLLVSSAAGSTAKNAAAVGGQTFHVSVDGSAKGANESFLAYFPNQVRVHPGDTVVFTWHGPGEPHTVTLGTDVDNAVVGVRQVDARAAEQPAQVGHRARCGAAVPVAARPGRRDPGCREPVLHRERRHSGERSLPRGRHEPSRASTARRRTTTAAGKTPARSSRSASRAGRRRAPTGSSACCTVRG